MPAHDDGATSSGAGVRKPPRETLWGGDEDIASIVAHSEIIDLGQRGLAIFVATLAGAVIWIDGSCLAFFSLT